MPIRPLAELPRRPSVHIADEALARLRMNIPQLNWYDTANQALRAGITAFAEAVTIARYHADHKAVAEELDLFVRRAK